MPAKPVILDDDEPDEPPPIFGPGRRKRVASGPVIEAYADGRIEDPCPDCGAPANQFCQHPNGTPRITPCGGRRTR